MASSSRNQHQPRPDMYTSADAAWACRNGAFITAWPADEPYFAPPSMDQLMRDMAPASTTRSGAMRTSSCESLSHLPGKNPQPGK
ncbi:hypothetical protein E4U09_000176 [Claviceps aff. purpurea]|uniref:Uncharacterized protein n=2 Tax=Claviceps TaxID=5110 RepID=M1W1L2_CLAP2|nr:hypothetical protein E4U38_000058 [Claviceps purpurea]KAG6299159.1 hypothetical protein E4U09_000176 [Claviceps aff. purpurea]CCE26900.1 uncharacterized protein CPUR_00369 [Claviceps purpurea 20.1]KAG6163018.1 hypothetical protein E4U11_002209 [Claviceps purpurea]KAG6209775.1 hypothetical protein E4U35_006595 [Claviceps purpurea]